MDDTYTYSHKYLAEEFEEYEKTSKASSADLSAFFDGFILGQTEKKYPKEDVEALRLLHYYRHFGHLEALSNPLKAPGVCQQLKTLLPLDTEVASFGLFKEPKVLFEQYIKRLKEIYCSSVGYEFLHCDKQIVEFIEKFIETPSLNTSKMQDLDIYEKLCKTEFFETFLHTRFPGQKRFSLEGLETSIVFFEESLSFAKDLNYKNIFFGMAHRGRLNMLSNIFNKPLSKIFQEFSKEYDPFMGEYQGDVKYHLGAKYHDPKGLNLVLSSNPSHLEAVDPVVLGMAYGKQISTSEKSLTFMIHGDASFAGQGVVYETMQLSKIKGFDQGGVIHVILNNQIGFTARPEESRATPYASDLARCFNCPIFHVNSEDIEAMQFISRLSLALLSKFNIDVMIDIIGYRKWGHNESDEPTFTQPILYSQLKQRKNPLEIFKQQLISKNPQILTDLEEIEERVKDNLKKEYETTITQEPKVTIKQEPKAVLNFSVDYLKSIGHLITQIPKGFSAHPKLEKLYLERAQVFTDSSAIDFPLAELLAFAVCLDQNKSLRFVGQDSARGTFSQRHAVLIDQTNETKYEILSPVIKKGQFCEIINSPLSEYAVLGFEYGFSKESLNSLNLWEAQFGDFANGAQIIIDQFIASGKTKWQDSSNLTLLLPHGYEGQGPEHTSGRIERFLELCSDNNMTVCTPTLPSQYFHILIKQISSKTPCVIFTPKALLRHPKCKSTLDELSFSSFQPLIDDNNIEATVVVLTFGKIAYDLKAILEQKNLKHISLIIIEQLYPLEWTDLKERLSKRKKLQKLVLVQDEPMNMGAYGYLKMRLDTLQVICRKQASSPASGYYKQHEKELKDILTKFENL